MMKTLKKQNEALKDDVLKAINKKMMDLNLLFELESIQTGKFENLQTLVLKRYHYLFKEEIETILNNFQPEKMNANLVNVVQEIIHEFKKQIGKKYEKDERRWN